MKDKFLFLEFLSWALASRLRSFLTGAILNLLLVTFVFILVPRFYDLGLALVLFGYFGIAGLIKISVGSRGVPLFFEGRLLSEREKVNGVQIVEAKFELNEGWSWVLPRPLMAAEEIDVREKKARVDEFTVISKNGVRIIIRPSVIRWRIDNPAQSLSISEDVITDSLVELLQNTIRANVAEMSDEEARVGSEGFRKACEITADKRSKEWGIDCREFLIGEIALPPEVQESYELLRREERQRDAEIVELKHVRQRMLELKKAGLSPEKAIEVVQLERKKVSKTIEEKHFSLSPELQRTLAEIAREIFASRRE